MSRVDDAELMQILERIGKLSQKPPNPGLAYRNLEMIEALVESLTLKMNGKMTGGENGKRKPPRDLKKTGSARKTVSRPARTGKTDASYG